MARASTAAPTTTPDQNAADFYLMFDQRFGSTAYGGIGQSKHRNIDPKEAAQCREARVDACRAFPKPGFWPESIRNVESDNAIELIMEESDFRNSREQWPTRLGYAAPRPKVLSHWFAAADWAMMAFHKVASPEWRDAIEAVEPNRHIFLPVTLCFKDQEVGGYSWVFNKQRVDRDVLHPERTDAIDPNATDGTRITTYEGDEQFIFENSAKYISGRRSVLSALHWAQYGSMQSRLFASTELAKVLQRLLSSKDKEGIAFRFVSLN